MNVRFKLLLLAIAPMLLSLTVTYFFVKAEYRQLSASNQSTLKNFLMEYKKQELLNYTNLAVRSIDHLYQPSNADNDVVKLLASNILDKMSYNGDDGYFFVYDGQGNSISHPKQPFRVGKNWWDLKSKDGTRIIQTLITNAKNGGGYHHYSWEKPSKNQPSEKLSYSIYLKKWDWMLGTGIYLDDANAQLTSLQAKMNEHIAKTQQIILSIAIASISIIFLTGVIYNLNSKKQTDLQLQELNQRMFTREEDERRRISRELHDGIIQILVSIKYSLESTGMYLKHMNQKQPAMLEKAATNLDSAISEIRRVSHNLHPLILDELGLGTAIDALSTQFAKRTQIKVEVTVPAVRKVLSIAISTALYRVVQESLINIEKHANASLVNIDCTIERRWLNLRVKDNGKGFTNKNAHSEGFPGIGLRNLKERVEFEQGVFEVSSSGQGTIILTKIPLSRLNKNNDNLTKRAANEA